MTKNTHRFEFKLGRTGLIFFIVCFSALLFGVFLLGVRVGKNIETYPEKLARFIPDRIRSLLSLPPDAGGSSVLARGDSGQEKQEQRLDLTFHDTLGKRKSESKGIAPDSIPADKTGSGGAMEGIATPPASMAPTSPPAAATPAPSVSEAQPPAEKKAIQDLFMVQVVSYRDKNKAKMLVKNIKALGYPARTEFTEIADKGKWHRVWMGEFSSRAEAQNAIDVISKKFKGLNCVIRIAEKKQN
jgi:cell division septation protein DedD